MLIVLGVVAGAIAVAAAIAAIVLYSVLKRRRLQVEVAAAAARECAHELRALEATVDASVESTEVSGAAVGTRVEGIGIAVPPVVAHTAAAASAATSVAPAPRRTLDGVVTTLDVRSDAAVVKESVVHIAAAPVAPSGDGAVSTFVLAGGAARLPLHFMRILLTV